jgi:hypothetical protein
MKAELKFLKDFYIQKKWYKADTSIEIEVDEANTPLDSVWFEQLRFEENKSNFQLITKSSPKIKSKE